MHTDSTKIAIVLITQYPSWYQGKLRSLKHTDKIRGDLALETITKAAQLGYHLVVSDGKSARTFFKQLKSIKDISAYKRKVLTGVSAKREALKKALRLPGIETVVMMEPEKLSLIDCIPEIARSLLADEADIVVPKREDRLFKESYPGYMFESEVEANTLYNEELRSHGLLKKNDENLDMFFGPVAFRNDKKIAHLFLRKFIFRVGGADLSHHFFGVLEHSTAICYPAVYALQKKMRVRSVSVSFKYPALQKKNEEEKAVLDFFHEKRKNQRLMILVELLHFVSYLEHNPGSKVRQKN